MNLPGPNKMKRQALAAILTFATLTAGTQPHAEPARFNVRCELAFSLMPSANSSPVTFALLTWYGDSPRPDGIQHITRQEFLAIASGLVESKANPSKENLFAKYEIQDCSYSADAVSKTVSYSCSVVDEIWKLRHKAYPARVTGASPGTGWATGEYDMSWGQLDYLARYGITSRNDFIHGEKAFRLLKDMQDPAWVSSYASH